MSAPITEKRCRKCDRTKPASEFYKEKRNSDGLRSYCAECSRKLSREDPNKKKRQAEYYQRNKDKILVDHARWRAENPDRMRELNSQWRDANREHIRESNARYYRENPARSKAMSRDWARRNIERVRECRREWGRNNRAKARIWEHARRARLKAAKAIPFTAEQLMQKWDFYGGKCWICGLQAGATDHVKPLAKGGAHILANLRPICTPCNSKKRDQWPLVAWMTKGMVA